RGSGEPHSCPCCCCSWALLEAHHLHRVAGQTLSVSCQYPPKGWPYERKGWCKELSAFKCTRLVTTSSPGRLVQASRFSIWDNPSAGLFTVTMTGLKEEDSGHYWCRIYHASSNSVSKSIRFYLAVSPASGLCPHVLCIGLGLSPGKSLAMGCPSIRHPLLHASSAPAPLFSSAWGRLSPSWALGEDTGGPQFWSQCWG
uniref:Ig-like domain-containing protein n=1 Tax=Ursus americanus TaxID=9643 RepID=A0A452RJP2_URSAM